MIPFIDDRIPNNDHWAFPFEGLWQQSRVLPGGFDDREAIRTPVHVTK